MRELSTKEHWDARHVGESARSRPRAAKRLLKRALGPRLLHSMRSYSSHVLWNAVYRPNVPRACPGQTALEIGSAPGEFLVRLREELGYQPFGVEYSAEGVRNNRRVFADAGIDPDHVLHADFFADDVAARHREAFDLVVSRGFIEHFDDPAAVVARHLLFLKPGGVLVVSIPNLRGVNGALTRVIDPTLLAVHNLDIMDERPFAALFDHPRLTASFCGYAGTFDFLLFEAAPGSRMEGPVRVLHGSQLLLNVALRAAFGDSGKEGRLFSPYLVYVGRKS